MERFVFGVLSGGEVGEPIVPQRGSVLGELPWAFRSGDDGAFIGDGSVSNRASEIVVLVPDGCTLERLNPEMPSRHPCPGRRRRANLKTGFML